MSWGRNFMKHRFSIVIILVILSASLAGGFFSGEAAPSPAAADGTSPSDFLTNFTEALDIIQENYAEDISPDKLVYSAIKGMLRALDPHSNFLDPKEFASLKEDQHSRYYGLGIRVRPMWRDRGPVVIIEPPDEDTPAKRQGLRAGDVITHIEGEPIDDWTSDEVVEHLRGPRGTTVHITVERLNVPDPIEFDVERAAIPMDTILYAFEIEPGIGYIKIERFSESTSDEFEAEIKALNLEHMTGLILDLRGNPGGLLNQAIGISDFFLPRNERIVSTKGRARGSVREYKADNVEKIRIPLVVLINQHSASASEIVAGALQDHDRALIVGETSFGKGLVQSVYTLENDTGMALTTARYYTPSGRLIQRDYSVSAFEYYYMNEEGANETGNDSNREIRKTDHGRTVLGGGGITPDIVVPLRELERFEGILTSKEVFFQYARRVISGQVPAAAAFTSQIENEADSGAEDAKPESLPDLVITDAILDDFKSYLTSRDIEFSEEDIAHSEDFIKRNIKQEVYNVCFGLQEGKKIEVRGDRQVLKALEVLPEARLLMTSGRTEPAIKNQSN